MKAEMPSSASSISKNASPLFLSKALTQLLRLFLESGGQSLVTQLLKRAMAEKVTQSLSQPFSSL